MRLRDLVAELPDVQWLQSGNPKIEGLATHSGRVRQSDLFIALSGDISLPDRHAFIPQAIEAGAAAVIVEREIEAHSVPIVQVANTHLALAHVAKQFYGSPADALQLVGVTGTSGKTSTVYLLHAILEAAGQKSGLIGTIEHHLGDRREPSDNSTPQAHDLHRMFRTMVDAGCRAAVMEVTSHALSQHRVAGIDYDIAIFTNLSRDHLDYHATPEAYLKAKALLFDNLRTDAIAIVNADDPAIVPLLEKCSAHIMRYGHTRSTDVRIHSGQTDWRGTELQLDTPQGAVQIHLSLQGEFQFYNAAAAVSAGLALGIAPEIIVQAVRDVRVPGRFESVDVGQDFGVFVDYAHKPDGLENVLKTARAFTSGRVICVFGCGGDRDMGKRPIMGELSARLADFTVVTSDNPRTEDPNAIIREILPGVGNAPHIVEPNRRKAIEMAIRQAKPNDLVLIAGKGHEDYQIIGRTKSHFDDREIAREILNALKPRG